MHKCKFATGKWPSSYSIHLLVGSLVNQLSKVCRYVKNTHIRRLWINYHFMC